MRTVPLGLSGVEVSIFCLGAMYFGTRNDLASSYRLLDQYVDAGGSFIDTANIYAWWVPGFRGGESEELLGGWLNFVAFNNATRICGPSPAPASIRRLPPTMTSLITAVCGA